MTSDSLRINHPVESLGLRGFWKQQCIYRRVYFRLPKKKYYQGKRIAERGSKADKLKADRLKHT